MIGRTQRAYILNILSCQMENENSSVTLSLLTGLCMLDVENNVKRWCLYMYICPIDKLVNIDRLKMTEYERHFRA